MRAVVEHEWLQKHPTPHAADGDFHWYPGVAAPDLRAELATATAAALSMWLAPGRVVVARRFSAIAPGDGRRYTGLAVSIATASGAPAAALLAALPLPPARPWDGDPLRSTPAGIDLGACAPADAVVPELVSAIWRGGPCTAAVDGLLARCAAIDTWLPAAVRASPRHVTIAEVAAVPPDLAAAVRWLAGAIGSRGDALERARRGWRALGALAATEERPIEAMFAEVAALVRAFASGATLRAHLASRGLSIDPRFHVDGDPAAQWSRVLHAWGRARTSDDRDLVAALLAQRAVADLLAGADERRWRATLRWESLIPTARADELERATLSRFAGATGG